jgi:hypothetical protein
MRISIVLIALLLSTLAIAQHTNFNTQRNWSLNKKELVFGFGATQFTGDLGGRDRIGTDFSLVDLDLPSTGFGGVIGYRYRFHPYWATTTNLHVSMIRGNDAFTNELIRESRNLSFRSMVIELSQRIECIIFANEKFGQRYSLPGHSGARNHNEQVYIFTGIGINYFNPKAKYQGSWVALDPLNTEGQGMTGGAKETLPISATIPIGIGFRFGVGRMWRFGIEATYVKTFTDYMDDVSTNYYDPNLLGSPAAQYLSNPAIDNTAWFAPGQQRGQAQKDAYYYLNIVVQKNITYKDYVQKRRSYHWQKKRYKF